MNIATVYKVKSNSYYKGNRYTALKIKIPTECLSVFDKKECVILCGTDETIKILNPTIDNNKRTSGVRSIMSFPCDGNLIGEYEITEIDNGLLLTKI